VSYSDIPADGIYYITTFGGGADTQGMACGGTADGTWAYVADEARYGCGAKLLIEGNGKACIGEVADCGPNRCVEEAACYCSCGGHFPILDASPLITQYLFGITGSGWSDKQEVTVTLVDGSTPAGCPAPPMSVDSGAGGGAAGAGVGGVGGGGVGGVGGGGGGGGAAGGGGTVSSGGATASGGASGNAGSATSGGAAGAASEDSGCSCGVAGENRQTPFAAVLALFALAAVRRRRVRFSTAAR
jgi:MYXO-CTERM domain-containing protein